MEKGGYIDVCMCVYLCQCAEPLSTLEFEIAVASFMSTMSSFSTKCMGIDLPFCVCVCACVSARLGVCVCVCLFCAPMCEKSGH